MAPDPVGDLMSGLDQNGLPVEPVDPLLGEPYVEDPQAPIQQPSSNPPFVRQGQPQPAPRDGPASQPDGRQPPERKGDALFF